MPTWRRAGYLFGIAGLFFLLLIGCTAPSNVDETGQESESIKATQAAISSGTATPTPSLAPPYLAQSPSPRETIAAPATPTSVATASPSGIQSPGADKSDEVPTPTPAPTFTPPPPPPILAGQQLWLRRPVPSSASSWTDKSYPYGSTRGGALRPHTGVEFVVSAGTPVLAAAAGTVIVAGSDSAVAYGPQTNFYGLLVIIEHDTNDGSVLYTLYGHLSEVQVEMGQRVATGDLLGLSGASGVADGPHIHLEIRVGTNSYESTRNPLLWLKPLPETGVVAGRITGANGQLLYEAPVTLLRVDGPAPYTATTSYAAGEPNGDDILRENFALDDVVPGFYEALIDTGSKRYLTELWVFPDRVNWVELVAGP